ncbi:unnamed protein product [Calypogeia fissa]
MAMDAASAAAPLRHLLTVACILSLGLVVLAARHYATAGDDDFSETFRFSGSNILQQEVVSGQESDAEEDLHREDGEKYIWPLLTDYVGTGNQLMEYISAAVVAHSLNRTLCLTPFQEGPAKHRGGLWHKGHGLAIQERYSMEQLSRFVRVASMDQCLSSCNHTLDDTWFLRGVRKSSHTPFDHTTNDAVWSKGKDMNWSFVSWTKTEDVRKALGQSKETCVALGGLFPGLRWRGAYLAVSAYLTASHGLEHSATTIRNQIIGHDTKYMAVHWRFEESLCRGEDMGSCFLRCGDGAIINTGLHPSAKEWIASSAKQCHFHAVKVTEEDVVGAIYDRAIERNLSTVYLATDGWVRGQEGILRIRKVVEMLRARNMNVVGLWRIEGLPNLSNGEYYLPEAGSTALRELFGLHGPEEEVNSRLIAGVEQELCNRAEVFLGSGQSTWSLAVFRSRLARRRAGEILKSLKGNLSHVENQQLEQRVHNQIIQGLLSDEHEAGILCGYHKYYAEFPVNATKETFEDEVPDGWLDLEACEMRMGHKGGQCEFATCIS